MLLLDFGSAFLTIYILSLRFPEIHSLWERLGLSVFCGLLLKSLVMFVLITAHVSPEAQLQTMISVALLASSVVAHTVRPPVESEEGSLPALDFKSGLMLTGVIGFLFSMAVLNAWFFPITEPDGILYHVRSLVLEREMNFGSEQIEIQFRRYPPFVPLVYVSLIAHGVVRLPLIFPVIYLALLWVVYGRVLAHTRNPQLASITTLILASTPYFWWHSVQPVLNLSAGAWYALGIFYWFSGQDGVLTKPDSKDGSAKRYFLLSGLCLSAAAWTRPEFLLYAAIPVGLMAWRLAEEPMSVRTECVQRIMIPLLIFPSLWGMTLLTFWTDLPSSSVGWMILLGCFWMGALVAGWGVLNLTRQTMGLLLLLIATVFFSTLFVGNKTSLTPPGAIGMGLFRTLGFQVFFSFTCFLALLLLISKSANMTSAQKDLTKFLFVYLIVHWMVYTWWPLKSTSVVQFFDSPFITPGNAVNSPDTREMIAFYPVLVFWAAQLRKVRRAFETA